MPVLVTDAGGALGHRIVVRLLAEGGEVRGYATGDGDLAVLRGAGAFVASGDPDDEGRLEAAMADVHTVVHAVDPVLAERADDVAVGARTVATAAGNAGVRRLIALSVPGATSDAADDLRRSAGLAEGALAASDVPTVVIRTSLIDQTELRDALATMRVEADRVAHQVAPLRMQDVVELVTAFDALRSQAHRGHVVFAADGPERMELRTYLQRAGVAGGGLVGRVYRAPGARPLVGDALRGPWTNEDPDLFDAWAFTGVRPAPVGPDAD